MAEKRVIVYRTSDPIQADMLGALLRENGIAACVLGTRHGAAIGVSQHILDLHIDVPHSQAGAATDFLEAFFESDGPALLAEHAGFAPEREDEDEDGEERDQPRAAAASGTHSLAAGLAALALLGGSHFYARRPVTALLLAAGQVAAFAFAFVACAAPVHGAVVVGTLLGLDFLGGQVAVRARRRGLRASAVRQLATGTVFVAVAAVLGALFAAPSGVSSGSWSFGRPAPAARPAY